MQPAKSKRTDGIRRRSRRAVLLPSAAFIALWLVVSGFLTFQAVQSSAAAQATGDLATPAAVSLTAVMDERSQTVAYLERPDETRADLEAARQASDERLQKVVDRLDKYKDLVPASLRERMDRFQTRYRGIGDIRAKVDEGTASREEVLRDYNRLMDSAARLFDAQSRVGPALDAVGAGVSATDVFRLVDLLAQSDAQLTRSFTNGRLTHDDQQEFTRLSSSYHGLLESVRSFLGPEQERRLTALMESEDYQRLVELENRIVGYEAEILMDPVTGEHTIATDVPVDREEWEAAYAPVKQELTDIGASQAQRAADIQSDAATRDIMVAAIGSVGAALIGFLAISAAGRTVNRIVRRLARLRDETDHRANVLLPDLVERLGRNEPVDTAAALPPLTARPDEIGAVAESFDKAQRSAVDAAVRQSEQAQGINRVFLNIAHRSQTLIHRQLRLLDTMEREQEDPAQLTELFKLDHLATRSRRNAENLLILGGETPGRTFHKPMPLVDVLRGAISESGDYTRVERRHIARVALKGPAVADVIHLVAELVDNATTFSPPHSQVRLSGEQVPNGVVVEIEDRGLGMQEEEFEAANDILANPPEFDVMRLNEKMRLGLFVVSRLAHRHSIGVRLRSSPYGGVQAIVLLPSELISGQPLPDAAFDNTGEQSREAAAASAGEGTPEAAAAVDAAAPAEPGEPGGGDGPGEPDKPREGAEYDGAGTDVLAAEPPDPAPTPPTTGDETQSAADTDYTPAGLPRRGAARRSPNGSGPVGSDGAAAPEPVGASAGSGDAPAHAPTGASSNGHGPGHSAPPDTDRVPEGAAVADPDAASGGTGPQPEGDGRPALPKRRPQANLAPQLYDESPAPAFGSPSQASPAQEDGEDRSARLRRNMSAFQQGTRRGRSESQQRQNDTERDS